MIGIFDSGVGGLSVLREIRAVLPEANLTYVADRARSPFGTKTLEEVEEISEEISSWLLERGATCLVVACNTASAAALDSLRRRHPDVPIVGMEPAVKPAAMASRTGKVAVCATAATFQGRLYASVVERFAEGTDVVTRACPDWVQHVEHGEIEGPEAAASIRDVVDPLIAEDVDVIVLGCTHFSFLGALIRRLSGLAVVDPAAAVAAQTSRVAPDRGGDGTLTMAASGDLAEFARLASALASIDEPVIPFAP